MESTALLIIAPAGRDRAVLAAELGERWPYRLCSAPTPEAGILLSRLLEVHPVLCLVISGEGITPAAVQQLQRTYPQSTLVLVHGVYDQAAYSAVAQTAACVLSRPVAIAEIVHAVSQLLPRNEQLVKSREP